MIAPCHRSGHVRLALVLVSGLSALAVTPAGAGDAAAPWRAGVGAADITPDGPIWLAGYAARTKPSEGVLQRIEARALALAAPGGPPAVIVTCDLVGFPRAFADRVAARIGAAGAIPRERIVLAASHTHSAPVIAERHVRQYRLDEAQRRKVEAYAAAAEEKLVEAAAKALGDLVPARLAAGHGTAGFARNRRRVNPDDPADHGVPLLAVDFAGRSGGAPARAALFAYACHNTTLDGYQVSGDYAGFARSVLEEARPGLMAFFVSGCGADANPEPRGTVELARRHGRELAEAVGRALDGPLVPIRADLQAAFDQVELPLAPVPSRRDLELQLGDPNVHVAIRARWLLEKLDAGEGIPASYPLPVQVIRLGADEASPPTGWTVVALGGEAVVDYALRLKRELGGARLMVAAYCNDVPAYIPSERVLREGGYEGGGAMVFYCLHGPWASGIEERIVGKVHGLLRRTGGGFGSSAAGGIVQPGARLERVWTDGEFTEGPAAGADGEVFFTDVPNQRILRLDPAGAVSVFKEPSGRANGLILDREGRLLACEGAAPGGGRRVVRYEKDGAVTVLAERFEGRRLNSPNDLAIDLEGRIYFSDPRYVGDEPREIERESVYRIEATGGITCAIDDVEKPNGLAVSPDGARLYVSDTAARKLYAYRIAAAGKLRREGLVFDFAPGRAIDGLEVDRRGAIYGAAGDGERSGVYAISPAGELLEFIPVPETATNCAFGGPDGRRLYITAGRSLYRIAVETPGFAIFPGSRR